MTKTLRPVVFLDRDGTLNEEIGYIREVSKLKLIPGAAQAVRRLNESGIATVLTTNQSGAARGYFPEEHILELNKRLASLLAEEGAVLDAFYYCPHLPDGSVEKYSFTCDCRKPEPGMVTRAFADMNWLDKEKAYVVGDKSVDVELAHNCGAKGVLVTTGYGSDVLAGKYQWPVKPDHIANDIVQAVDWILKDLNHCR